MSELLPNNVLLEVLGEDVFTNKRAQRALERSPETEDF